MSKKRFFIGKGWEQDLKGNIIALCIEDEQYQKQPVIVLKNGTRVRYLVVGRRLDFKDKVSGATHYVAPDTKVRANEDDRQGEDKGAGG